ncbi:MAG: TonB family protein [Bacteroidales bacterium]|nr:TonB family protein [Bacteroidales bacterium]MBN2821515.1 TonB family protein [Bacteroidales bacterium]
MDWNNRAFLLTAGVYTLALFFFLFFGFITPLPLPSEEGIMINFGDDETGFGNVEPRPVERVVKQPEVKQVSTPVPVQQTQMTQDYEDAPAVEAPKQQKQTVTTPKEPEKKVEEKVEEKPEPVVDQRALFGKNRNTTSTASEGESGGNGNQGSENGDVTSDNHSLGGGVGDGISFSLDGRSALSLPSPVFDHQKEGKVVVQVTVDRTGRVTNAIPGVKGSTTLDNYLLAAAKKAALSSKFNTKEDAPLYQSGTITYVFRLR